ncbi:hypothetical protein ACJX0J_011794, partial [Zea mays]
YFFLKNVRLKTEKQFTLAIVDWGFSIDESLHIPFRELESDLSSKTIANERIQKRRLQSCIMNFSLGIFYFTYLLEKRICPFGTFQSLIFTCHLCEIVAHIVTLVAV